MVLGKAHKIINTFKKKANFSCITTSSMKLVYLKVVLILRITFSKFIYKDIINLGMSIFKKIVKCLFAKF